MAPLRTGLFPTLLRSNFAHSVALALAPIAAAGAPTNVGGTPDIAIILLDDVGVDRIAAYAEHPDPGNTPNIDDLAANGVLFRRAYVNPVCSASRAAILTGRYAHRTGIGGIVRHPNSGSQHRGLRTDIPTIADSLPTAYRDIALGKWHLADGSQLPAHPFELGFRAHAGSLFNLNFNSDYFLWEKSVNGVIQVSSTYATSDLADDAERYLIGGSGPNFLWICPNAAHKPLHAPPPDLHSFNLFGLPGDTPIVHFKAMVEALDHEIGRIITALGPDAVIVLMGDNGPYEEAIAPPFPTDHGKGSVYEGGVRVPLIIRAPGMAQGECNALVNLTDLFATVVELAGGAATAPDSISLVPYLINPATPSLRPHCYVERFKPHGDGPYSDWRQAIVAERYKLIRSSVGPDELYDLHLDRFEQDDLLARNPVDPEHLRIQQYFLGELPVTY